MTEDLSQESMAYLRAIADGCREHTCPEHGHINREIARRADDEKARATFAPRRKP